jgi:hypothetical protein
MKTREEKALGLAAAPGGRSLREVRELWREVQRQRGNLDSAWLNPVKLSSDRPSLGDIRYAMQLPREAEYVSWGAEAVDDFYVAYEGVDEDPEFLPIADLVRGPSIKKRWYFAGGGGEWSTNVLIVLDEHNQLWGMQMGYSE